MLDNILYARAYTSEHQYELLDYVAAKFHEEAGVFKLLVRKINIIYQIYHLHYKLFMSWKKNYKIENIVILPEENLK